MLRLEIPWGVILCILSRKNLTKLESFALAYADFRGNLSVMENWPNLYQVSLTGFNTAEFPVTLPRWGKLPNCKLQWLTFDQAHIVVYTNIMLYFQCFVLLECWMLLLFVLWKQTGRYSDGTMFLPDWIFWSYQFTCECYHSELCWLWLGLHTGRVGAGQGSYLTSPVSIISMFQICNLCGIFFSQQEQFAWALSIFVCCLLSITYDCH